MDNRLQDSIDRASILFIVGTGFSAAATKGASFATWRGLISDGINRAEKMGASSTWGGVQRSNLDLGFDENLMESILVSSSAVQRKLSENHAMGFEKWLHDTVGSLEETDETLGKALRRLPYPILTTNYDTLLSNKKRPPVDWQDGSRMHEVIAGTSESIGHLHGRWDNPTSVIFSNESYNELLQSDTAQALQHAASTLRSIVYVGFGAGLEDPNFSQLIAWHRDRFGMGAVPHFRLGRASDIERLKIEHAVDHIIPVPYGDTYADLPTFLDSMRPTGPVELTKNGIARDIISELQIEFADEMKNDAIIADTIDDVKSRDLGRVILPPVLLPVPHSEYLKARAKKNKEKLDRLDPAEEVKSAEVLIIAAEESSGLTTAVRWLVLAASQYLPGTAPIFLRFQSCRRQRNPIEHQIKTEARSKRLIDRHQDSMPPFVLGIDDFSPYVDKISESALQEIADSESFLTILGCSQGSEEEIAERLGSLGVRTRVRYLGKLSASDVRSYARLVSPSNFETMASRVIDMLRTENLARTPSTVSLLLSVLSQGGQMAIANMSETSILDDYIGLLLGRGDPHEDARFGLDQPAREELLSSLAGEFVRQERGGLTETDVTKSFQDTFDRLSWDESPTEVLKSFLDLRVLRRKGKHIEFARSSFLHIFAAKQAISSKTFRELLFERPLYYSDAITDYAALYRRDEGLLRRLADLVGALNSDNKRETYYQVLELSEPELRSLESNSEDGDVELEASRESTDGSDPSDADSGQNGELVEWGDEYFDLADDEDLPPFPTIDEDRVPEPIQMFRTLEIASIVLRDSWQVEDLGLRKKMLGDVIRSWRATMDVMHDDSSFGYFVKTFVRDLDLASEGEQESEDLLKELTRAIPAAFVLGAVGGTLSSKKLTLLLNQVIEESSEADGEDVALIAAFFLYGLGEQGWPKRVEQLLSNYGNVWVVHNFLLHLFTRSFTDDDVVPDDSEDLLGLILGIVAKGTRYETDQDRRSHRAQVKDDLEAARLQRRTFKRYTPLRIAKDTDPI